MRPHIVVIGSGIAGLAAAWLASRRARVTLVERDSRIGGHSNTVGVTDGGRMVPIDTGFIVYNTACYPNLIALFDHLQVPTAPSSMGFAVSLDAGRYEYSGSGLGGLFADPRNVLRPGHLGMIAEILRFFREATAVALAPEERDGPAVSLGEWLRARRYGPSFVERHIVPMAAAIWSAPNADVLAFPAAAFIRFFANHGLLKVRNRPRWRTVEGGSREYVRRLLADADLETVIGAGARRVTRRVGRAAPGVEIELADGRHLSADQVVIATHADEALGLLGDPDDLERRLLGAFRYAPNRAVLHRDPRLMPRRRRVWSSWNVIGGAAGPVDLRPVCTPAGAPPVCVTYWMNRLQPLATATDYFVTLNPIAPIDAADTVAAFDYMHPLFDTAALEAQADLWSLQGRRNTWFAGSYFGYGFHEDAAEAGLSVAEQATGAARPWRVPDGSWRRVRVTAPAGTSGAWVPA